MIKEYGGLMLALALAVILMLALEGCAIAPKVVKVPVKMACDVAMPVKPVNCHSLNENRVAWLKCELALARENEGYITELETALEICKSGN